MANKKPRFGFSRTKRAMTYIGIPKSVREKCQGCANELNMSLGHYLAVAVCWASRQDAFTPEIILQTDKEIRITELQAELQELKGGKDGE